MGLLGIMFFGKTRFKELSKALDKLKKKKAKLATLVALTFSFVGFSQNSTGSGGNNMPTDTQIDSILQYVVELNRGLY